MSYQNCRKNSNIITTFVICLQTLEWLPIKWEHNIVPPSPAERREEEAQEERLIKSPRSTLGTHPPSVTSDYSAKPQGKIWFHEAEVWKKSVIQTNLWLKTDCEIILNRRLVHIPSKTLNTPWLGPITGTSTQVCSIFAIESILSIHPTYWPPIKVHYGICANGLF